MKLFLISLFLFLSINNSFSQLIHFEWAKSLDRATGLTFDEKYLIGVDGLKNVYVAGNFRNTMDLDPGPGVTNVNSQWDNVFINKLDSNGIFIWGKQIGGDRVTIINSLYVDAAGNIYSTGRFSGTADFDPGPGIFNLSATYPTTPECNAIFISKLDMDGNFKWAKKIGGSSPEFTGLNITGDKFGNIYTTGYFVNIADFDPGPGVDNHGSDGVINPFIEKLDSSGNFIFSKVFNSDRHAISLYIKTDNDGNIYTSGNFTGKVDFDPGPDDFILTDLNSESTFMSKLDSAGRFIWAKKGIGNCYFAVDALQNIITFSGNSPGLLTKYDINGNEVWSKTTGGSPYVTNQNSPIVLDEANNIYLTGMFRYTLDFDPGPGVYNLTVTGGKFNSDVFISRLDANGDFVWAVSFGGYAEDYANSIAVDNSGNVYTTGVYVFKVDFDPGPGIFNMEPKIAGGGIFIHKMGRCINTSYSGLSINACNDYTLNNITYNKSGSYIQTIRNKAGCDSIITLNLVIGGTNDTYYINSCEDYTWNNQLYNLSGVYTDTLISKSGCDSIINLNLTINHKSFNSINSSICEGQTYLGHALSGTYIDTFKAANGCDSIRTLNLTVNKRKYSTLNYSICEGQSYLGYFSDGTYSDTLIAANGCDSIRTLYLKVNPKYSISIIKAICEGQSYLGHTLPGNYIDTLQTQFGCDSIVNSTITILLPPTPKLGTDTLLCIGDSLIISPGIFDTYLWQDGSTKNRYTINKPGLYSLNVSNVCGTGYAQINIAENTCKLYFPNAFTPNNDGKNDVFKILNAFNLSNFQLIIFNRFGEKVFETNDYLKGWDGNFKHQKAETGIYIWICSFKENNTLRNIKGTVVLLK